jgi:hypothetical protein
MRAIRSLVTLCVLTAALVPGAGRAETAVEERAIPQDRAAQNVIVLRDLRTAGDTVSGTVVNRGPDPVRDIRLVISRYWLWNDEMHPGNDEFSRSDYYTVPDEIPPGGQAAFTARPATPLRQGPDGRFMTDVSIASFVEMQKPGRSSPTAGAGSVERPRRLESESPGGIESP